MASSAAVSDLRTPHYIRLDTSATELEFDFDPLLGTLISQTRADSAAIYRFDPGSSEFTAAAVRSSARPLVRTVGVSLTPATSGWLFSLAEPSQVFAATDERFELFPELFQFGIATILAVPFRSSEKLLGILTLGRAACQEFGLDDVLLAQRTVCLICAVMERDELQQRLRGRKVIERAKGIIPKRNGLAEERACILLHNTSRRGGLPMFDIA
jgi:GAF domain-containing protein